VDINEWMVITGPPQPSPTQVFPSKNILTNWRKIKTLSREVMMMMMMTSSDADIGLPACQ